MNDVQKEAYRPILLSYKALEELRSENASLLVMDSYLEQLEEVFLLQNPYTRFEKNYQPQLEDFIKSHSAGMDLKNKGSWFFYPWLNTAVHILEEPLFFEMRTGRNRYLITKEEQLKYYQATAGILGMSVGSHAALTMAMTGGPKNLRLADPDTISGSNLNRIRTGVQSIGVSKVILTARLISEMNPYSNIEIYPEGLTEQNMENFLEGNGALDILIEEMDNPYMKLKVREVAGAKGMPVIMATDNGDNIFVDIERYDTTPDLPLLNGIAEGLTAEKIKNLKPSEIPKTAAQLAGASSATLRMQKSVLEVGKSIYSWPQLGTAANLCGSAVAYLARKIILKDENIASGRYEVNLDSIFEKNYSSSEQVMFRQKETGEFLKKLGL